MASILGIEYSKDSIKIVEVSYARRIKILNFAVIDNGAVPPERRMEQLQHLLQTRGFEATQAIVAFSGPGVEHRLLSLPPLSPREMQFVMTREAKKVATKDALWSYDLVTPKEELGIKKQQILLVTSDADGVKEVEAALTCPQIKIVQVTTVADSLLNLLSNSGTWKKDSVRCVIHMAGNRINMIFARDGALLTSRDIQFDYADVSQEEQTGRLVTELKRSTLFFRQNFPQARIEEFLFSGENKLIGALAAAVRQEFGVESGMLRFEDSIDTAGLRGDWDALRFNLAGLSVAIGAAWRKTPGSGINLLPNSRKVAKRSTGFDRLVKFAIPASLALVLLSGSYYFANTSSIETRKGELQHDKNRLQPILDRAAQEADLKQVLADRDAFVEQATTSVDWTEILRRLTHVVPNTVVFENIRIERQPRLTLVIHGSVVAPSTESVYGDFNSLISGMKQIPQLGPPVMAKQPSAISTGAGQSQINFEVRCDLK